MQLPQANTARPARPATSTSWRTLVALGLGTAVLITAGGVAYSVRRRFGRAEKPKKGPQVARGDSVERASLTRDESLGTLAKLPDDVRTSPVHRPPRICFPARKTLCNVWLTLRRSSFPSSGSSTSRTSRA